MGNSVWLVGHANFEFFESYFISSAFSRASEKLKKNILAPVLQPFTLPKAFDTSMLSEYIMATRIMRNAISVFYPNGFEASRVRTPHEHVLKLQYFARSSLKEFLSRKQLMPLDSSMALQVAGLPKSEGMRNSRLWRRQTRSIMRNNWVLSALGSLKLRSLKKSTKRPSSNQRRRSQLTSKLISSKPEHRKSNFLSVLWTTNTNFLINK